MNKRKYSKNAALILLGQLSSLKISIMSLVVQIVLASVIFSMTLVDGANRHRATTDNNDEYEGINPDYVDNQALPLHRQQSTNYLYMNQQVSPSLNDLFTIGLFDGKSYANRDHSPNFLQHSEFSIDSSAFYENSSLFGVDKLKLADESTRTNKSDYVEEHVSDSTARSDFVLKVAICKLKKIFFHF
jgi:hypothetical protein